MGHPVELWRFPDRTTSVGQMISAYLTNKSQLDDHTIHLLFSANRWEKRSMMETKLKAGTTLIVDRYSYSGVAFSSAKGLDFEWCKAPEIGLIAPDLVLYLDITPEKAAERGGYGGERYEQLEFQKKVAQRYKLLEDSSWKFDPLLNHPRACRFHTAHFGGETKRKFESVYAGGTMDTPDSGKVFQYWHCCGSEDPFDPGCTAAPHASYDD
ncbi:Thymidylate kinase [Corchorus olitorius]|uniref:dTMP kinase n=1 Tax=Corchorus olitorius TaxID=93759 RepID=A0A1R3HSR7_9ROSI|nr:Thymidylate kinase [Corchorus olitorius]